jgi:Flp pilus assembly protein CpaB
VENIMSSKLFTTRQGTIWLGVIAAAIAAIALLVYLNNYRNSVNGTTAPTSVLVAKSLIQQGTSGHIVASSDMYQITSIPTSQVKTGAFVDPSTLAGTYALTDIYPGQQLTAADFGTSTNPLIGQLAKNQRAVVVALDSPQQVGGQIGAGSHVDVWVAFNGQNSSGVTRPVVHEIYQNLTVLNSDSSGGNVTLQATPAQAGKLIWASLNAQIWLVLRPTVGSTSPTAPQITANDLLKGGG